MSIARKPAPSPINPDAERATLGGLLIDAADGTPTPQVVRWIDLLEPGDFYVPETADVFAAIQTVHRAGHPVELQTVQEAQRQAGTLHDRGVMLSSLIASCTTSANTPYYARIVLENGIKRKEGYVGDRLQRAQISAPEAIGQLEALQARLSAADADQVQSLAALMRQELPPLRFIVPKFLPEGLAILAAKGKIGKSWLAYALSIAIATGGVFLGQRVEAGAVLYLALEDGPRRLQARARKLQGTLLGPDEAWPDGLDLVRSRAWPERLGTGLEGRLECWLREHPSARLVVIDVYAKVAPAHSRNSNSAYLEDYAAMTGLQALAERSHVAIVVIHHTRKASAEDVYDELNGTSGLAGAADTLLVLQRPRDEDEGVLHVTGREIEQETSYTMLFSRETCIWTLADDQNIDPLASQEAQDVLRILKSESRPWTPERVATALGVDRNDRRRQTAIRKRLSRLADRVIIGKAGFGRYTFGSAGDDAVHTQMVSHLSHLPEREAANPGGKPADGTLRSVTPKRSGGHTSPESVTGEGVPCHTSAPSVTVSTLGTVTLPDAQKAANDADLGPFDPLSVTGVTHSEYAHAQRNGRTPDEPGPMTRRLRELVAQGLDGDAAADQALRERGILPPTGGSVANGRTATAQQQKR